MNNSTREEKINKYLEKAQKELIKIQKYTKFDEQLSQYMYFDNIALAADEIIEKSYNIQLADAEIGRAHV